MITTTSDPNFLMLSYPLESWGNQDPALFRASIVVLLELGEDSIKLWYVHHQYYKRPLSGKGPWEPQAPNTLTLDEALKGMISYVAMQEFWKFHATAGVQTITEDSPEVVRRLEQQLTKHSRAGRHENK